jgi:hypothetical protein
LAKTKKAKVANCTETSDSDVTDRPAPRIFPEIDPERLERDRAAVEPILQQALSPATPSLGLSNKTRKLGPLYPSQRVGHGLLMKAIGTADADFVEGFLGQLQQVAFRGSVRDCNFIMSVVKGVQPRDQQESMIALQMGIAHVLAMRAASRLRDATDFDAAKSSAATTDFVKLTKASMNLMAGLKHLRTGGEQKITVQYVNVNEGGQAIVGDVTHSSSDKSLGQPETRLLVDEKPALAPAMEPTGR